MITSINLIPAVPEIIVLVMGSAALMAEVFVGHRYKNVAYYLVQLALIAAAVFSLLHWNSPSTVTFSGSLIQDKFSILFKEAIYISAFLSFVYSRNYVPEHKMPRGEYYVLGLFSVLGMMVLVSAGDFLTLFLGLELMALPIYTMVALERQSSKCSEAAMKYFIVGSMATAILLYGLSMIYGAAKTIDLHQAATFIATFPSSHRLILGFGLAFIVLGITFKFGAAPFHMWVPDVYEGAPSSVTLFLSAAPKIAALALAIRLLVDAMPGLVDQWRMLLILISVASMAWGNLAAIAQTNIKRMLAYSSIAHVGYALLGILAGTKIGYGAATFYILSYSLMTLASFGALCLISHSGVEIEQIDDFEGLSERNPWLAFMVLIIMFSMAGVPPLIGFMAKVGVLEAVINVHLTWLAIVAILFAIIGAYYYLRVVKVMYFEEPKLKKPFQYALDGGILISINAIVILLLGIFPGFLFNICHNVF